MSKILILDKKFGGIEYLVDSISTLQENFPEMPVIVNEPALKAALSAKNISSELIPHLLTEEEDIELYSHSESICRKINDYLGKKAGAIFEGINLFDLSLLDIAYTLRHLISLDYLAERKFSNIDWVFASMRLRFTISYKGIYTTEVLPPPHSQNINRIEQSLRRSKNLQKISRNRIIPIVKKLWEMSTLGIGKKSLSKRVSLPKNQPDKACVLFALTETASKIASSSFLPLIQELKKRKDIQTVIVVNSQAASVAFEKAGVTTLFPPETFSSIATKHRDNLVHILERQIRMQIDKLTPGSPEYNIWTNYLDYGMEGLDDSYRAITFFKNLYEHLKPNVTVTNNDRAPLGKVAVLMARELGIPSMLYFPCLIKVHSWFRDCYTDAIGVYGLHGEQCVKTNGLGDRKIYRIGNPKFDNMVHRDREHDKKSVFKKLNIPTNHKLILIIGSLVVKDAEKWMRALTREFALHNEPSLSVWIKPHPGDVMTEYELLIKANKAESKVNLLTIPIDNYELLSASDIVITDFSTLGSEALLMQIPVMTINLTDKPYCVRFEEYGAAELVTSIDKFWEKLIGILNDPEQRNRFGKEYAQVEKLYGEQVDGMATKRFIKAIEDLGGF